MLLLLLLLFHCCLFNGNVIIIYIGLYTSRKSQTEELSGIFESKFMNILSRPQWENLFFNGGRFSHRTRQI